MKSATVPLAVESLVPAHFLRPAFHTAKGRLLQPPDTLLGTVWHSDWVAIPPLSFAQSLQLFVQRCFLCQDIS